MNVRPLGKTDIQDNTDRQTGNKEYYDYTMHNGQEMSKLLITKNCSLCSNKSSKNGSLHIMAFVFCRSFFIQPCK